MKTFCFTHKQWRSTASQLSLDALLGTKIVEINRQKIHFYFTNASIVFF